MATAKATLIAIALAAALPSMAQGEVPAFCLAEDPGDPDYDIADFDAQRDSDDWCKLAYHQPHKARRQLSKAVALVRTHNNPNRHYLDPRRGTGCCSEGGDYIQLLRPWMAEQNAAGTHDWRVYQYDRNNPVRDTANRLVHVEAITHAVILNKGCDGYGCYMQQYIQVLIRGEGGFGADGISYSGSDISTAQCSVDRSSNDSANSNHIALIKTVVERVLDDLQADCTGYAPITE